MDQDSREGAGSVQGDYLLSTANLIQTLKVMTTTASGLVSKVQLVRAWRDIAAGWCLRRLWGTLALQDIRQRYRRSKIGPFWLTISMGVMIGALGLLYGTLFKIELGDFLPYVAAGFVVWGLMSGFVMDSTNSFIAAEGLIRQLSVPLSVHIYRDIWRNLLIFAHNFWIFVIISLLFGVFPGPFAFLLALLGVSILALNALWLGLLLGLISARFRDIPQIIASVIQVTFFLTPIIWQADMLPERAIVLNWNPFYHFLELVRAPLLGQFPSFSNWVAVLLMTATGWLLTIFIYAKYRWRIAYWV
ncbi:MAG: ABC transporter permease [Halochromatium sp.]|nr:ABC transporter permease [Halochromatium sp.]